MKKIIFLFFTFLLSANATAACDISIAAADNMMFDKRKITVDTSCTEVSINFKHTGKMPIKAGGHNVVIIETKDFNTVIGKIDMKLGADNGFLPEIPEVIVKTAIIGGGGDAKVAFDPKKLKKDGKYTFLCSFPGHYAIMKGVVEVI
ncbi:MAG: azurin [Betaproteobacteria bacterium TMED82]|nr:MAG: azurin [Betaproteobacteria bacterium TMED82]|tara:strand:+ start:4103 stop:4543 length:441 start_codon:yes stop_codon:yes gene_type:complete